MKTDKVHRPTVTAYSQQVTVVVTSRSVTHRQTYGAEKQSVLYFPSKPAARSVVRHSFQPLNTHNFLSRRAASQQRRNCPLCLLESNTGGPRGEDTRRRNTDLRTVCPPLLR